MKVGKVKDVQNAPTTEAAVVQELQAESVCEVSADATNSNSVVSSNNTNAVDDNGQGSAVVQEKGSVLGKSIPEQTVSQEVQPAELSEELFWARAKLLGNLATTEQELELTENRLTEAKARLAAVTQEKLELEERLPGLKLNVEDARTNVINVARDLSVIVRENRLPTRRNELVARDQSQPATGGEQSSAVASVEDSSWRNYSTAELLKSVQGIGDKKIEAIVEIAPTVGHLEDLRREASEQHKSFREMLPKGCKGEITADAVDNAVCNYVAEWSKKRASGAPTARALAEKLYAEIKQVSIDATWRAEDCELGQGDNEYHHAGYTACVEGKPYTNLSTSKEDNARDWITGYICAEVLRDAKKKDVDESNSSADVQSGSAAQADQPAETSDKKNPVKGRKKQASAKAKKPSKKKSASIADQF